MEQLDNTASELNHSTTQQAISSSKKLATGSSGGGILRRVYSNTDSTTFAAPTIPISKTSEMEEYQQEQQRRSTVLLAQDGIDNPFQLNSSSNEDLRQSHRSSPFGTLKKSISRSASRILKSLSSSRLSTGAELDYSQAEPLPVRHNHDAKKSTESLSNMASEIFQPPFQLQVPQHIITDPASKQQLQSHPISIGTPQIPPTSIEKPKKLLGGLFGRSSSGRNLEIKVPQLTPQELSDLLLQSQLMQSTTSPSTNIATAGASNNSQIVAAGGGEMHPTPGLIVLDLRSFVEYNHSRIFGSYNVNITPLMLRRINKSSKPSLKLEQAIFSDLGKSVWQFRTNTDKIVIADKSNDGSAVFESLVKAIESEMDNSQWKGQPFTLRGGFQEFERYCMTSHQKLASDGSILSNNRWIDRPVPDIEQSSTNGGIMSADGSTVGGIVSGVPPSLDGSVTSPVQVAVGTLFSFLRLGNKRQVSPNSSTSKLQQPAPLAVSDSQSNLTLDCTEILDWLYLGADPAVMTPIGTNNTSGIHSPMSTSSSQQELYINLPSPSATTKRPNHLIPPTLHTSQSQHQLSRATSSSNLITTRLHLRATAKRVKENQFRCIINVAEDCVNINEHIASITAAPTKPPSESPNSLATALAEDWQVDAYHKLGMQDYADEQSIEVVINKAISLIDAYHDKAPHNRVYVHCKAGRSRSVTVVVAYLMEKMGWSLKKAYEYVQMRRPVASPNLGFMAVLQKRDKSLAHS